MEVRLSFEEAAHISQAYSYLLNTTIDQPGLPEVVDEILPAPYDDLSQWFFFQFYRAYGHAEAARHFYRRHCPFDVIVVIRQQHPQGAQQFKYMTLKHFMNIAGNQAG